VALTETGKRLPDYPERDRPGNKQTKQEGKKMNDEAMRKREAERATQLLTQLLHNYKMSSWDAGFCQGLLSHAPTQRQNEILDRLCLKYGIDEEGKATTEQTESHEHQPSGQRK
jgi:hypothetical protein